MKLEEREEMRRAILLFSLLLAVTFAASKFSVGILITGEIGGNAIYELVQRGALEMASEEIEIKIVEGGYNQSKWEQMLISLAALGRYDLLMTFTEGMPASVNKVAEMFPNQKFALLDGIIENPLPNTYSVAFKDDEMTFLAGIFAALITSSSLPGANEEKVVGLIAGDTYPAMTNVMRPSFENGVKTVHPSIRVFFGVVGSWSDPARGSEFAAKQFDAGADVILSIAGGSGIGVIEEASVRGKYVITVDSNMIALNPSVILGSFLKHIDVLVKNTIADAKAGTLPFGTSKRVGIAEGMIDYTHDDPNFVRNVPDDIRAQLAEWFEKIKAEGLPKIDNE